MNLHHIVHNKAIILIFQPTFTDQNCFPSLSQPYIDMFFITYDKWLSTHDKWRLVSALPYICTLLSLNQERTCWLSPTYSHKDEPHTHIHTHTHRHTLSHTLTLIHTQKHTPTHMKRYLLKTHTRINLNDWQPLIIINVGWNDNYKFLHLLTHRKWLRLH